MVGITSLEELVRDRAGNTFVVGESALACAGLISGYNHIVVWTPEPLMDRVRSGRIIFQHWHLHDTEFCGNATNLSIFYPSAEKAIIDTILWQHKYYNEGFLIEALQTYQSQKHVVSDLYECANHYLIPIEMIQYWWKEAEEESDMSMG